MSRPIEELKPDPKNPRRIDDKALAGLAVSVEEFGDLSSLVWNERSGNLVCGHQRMKTLTAAGAKTWTRKGDAGWIEHPATGERFTVRIVNWDDTTERLANLAANNPAIQGEFTREALDQLAEMESHVQFEALGLDALQRQLQAELDAFTEGEPQGGQTDPDDVPEPPAEPVSKRGDLWLLGEHRLLVGDSTDAADVARLTGGGRPKLGLHDPPYGIAVVESGLGDGRKHGNAVAKRGTFQPIIGDDKPFDPTHLIGTADVVVLWGANHFADKLPPRAGWIVWDKRVDLPSNGFSDCELAWVSDGGSARIIRHMWNGMIRQSEMGEPRVHPTQKPVAVQMEIIERFTNRGDTVHDGYGGSGATLLAAERTGRVALLAEMAPAYCDVIVARWEAYTGRKAIRADR